MPTATGLPKAGDYIYNAFFKVRFRVIRRDGNSFPLSIFIRPMPGKPFPELMVRPGRSLMPDGTYKLSFEAPPDEMFRMGLSHWTMLPDANEVPEKQCSRDVVHGKHLFLSQRVWHLCWGIKSPEKPEPEKDAAPPDADSAFDKWYRGEFGRDPGGLAPEYENPLMTSGAALRSAFEAGRRFEQSKEK